MKYKENGNYLQMRLHFLFKFMSVEKCFVFKSRAYSIFRSQTIDFSLSAITDTPEGVCENNDLTVRHIHHLITNIHNRELLKKRVLRRADVPNAYQTRPYRHGILSKIKTICV
jgi:hypothetical protein